MRTGPSVGAHAHAGVARALRVASLIMTGLSAFRLVRDACNAQSVVRSNRVLAVSMAICNECHIATTVALQRQLALAQHEATFRIRIMHYHNCR
uniref:Uncharacterized protein n=1 Tax=Rhipicephalus zambeziensis TaxID=60191 RepID=A0A224YGD0_9ACAR